MVADGVDEAARVLVLLLLVGQQQVSGTRSEAARTCIQKQYYVCFLLPQELVMEAPFLRSCDFTVFF